MADLVVLWGDGFGFVGLNVLPLPFFLEGAQLEEEEFIEGQTSASLVESFGVLGEMDGFDRFVIRH